MNRAAAPLLRVQELQVNYHVHARGRQQLLRAVNGVSFDIAPGEALGVVGESGSGKSSLARALLRLVDAHRGRVLWRGVDLLPLTGAALRAYRRPLQLIFQHPLASLDPRMSVIEIVAEPLRAFEPQLTRAQRHVRALQALQSVGLEREHGQRLPHEFSGGQAQRIAIARALVAHPELLVCDEPLSALDLRVKAQISQLLQRLRREQQLSLLFISHDLPAVHDLCDRVLVLYLGKVMEIASRDAWFAAPRHPYSRALLQAVPPADPVAARARPFTGLEGEIPSPLEAPSGCVFRTRCPLAIERCALETPELRVVGTSTVACHRAEVSDPGCMW